MNLIKTLLFVVFFSSTVQNVMADYVLPKGTKIVIKKTIYYNDGDQQKDKVYLNGKSSCTAHSTIRNQIRPDDLSLPSSKVYNVYAIASDGSDGFFVRVGTKSPVLNNMATQQLYYVNCTREFMAQFPSEDERAEAINGFGVIAVTLP
jgi:hypothetical protein